jgi:hypothetical protein
MSGALDRVQWGEVFGDLWDASPREVRAAAAHCVARSAYLDLGPMTFAVLVCQMPRRLLWRAIEDHSDLDPLLAGAWLEDIAHIAVASTQPEIPVRAFPADVVADISPGLHGLPLLDAAAEHAEATTGRLGVYLADLGPAITGRCARPAPVLVDGRPAEATIIELSPGHTAWDWLHELGHAFDPERGQRTQEEREAYADALAEQLATLPPHAPLSAVQPLAEQAYLDVRAAFQRHRHVPIEHTREVPAQTSAPSGTGADWPAPGLASLLAFAALPLLT